MSGNQGVYAFWLVIVLILAGLVGGGLGLIVSGWGLGAELAGAFFLIVGVLGILLVVVALAIGRA